MYSRRMRTTCVCIYDAIVRLLCAESTASLDQTLCIASGAVERHSIYIRVGLRRDNRGIRQKSNTCRSKKTG